MTNQEYAKIVADFDTVTNKLYGIEKSLHNGIDEIKTELEEVKKCIEQFRAERDEFLFKGSDLVILLNRLNHYDEDKRNIRRYD